MTMQYHGEESSKIRENLGRSWQISVVSFQSDMSDGSDLSDMSD